MKTERPILFSGEMVRAVLEGRKTQTRRVVKPQAQSNSAGLTHYKGCLVFEHDIEAIEKFCPYGQPGDRLWVRESHGFAHRHVYFQADETFVSMDWFSASAETLARFEKDEPGTIEKFAKPRPYKGAGPKYEMGPDKWRPSIHMPRAFSRIDLEITGVRVERLQEISEADARAEGGEPGYCGGCGAKNESSRCIGCMHPFWKAGFERLWDSINRKRKPEKPDVSWSANPYVWVVEFKRVEGGV